MDDTTRRDLADPNQMFGWAMDVNLNEIIRYHNILRGDLSNRAFERQGDGIDDRVARDALENYDRYLASNTFLMVYAYLEEYLYLVWKGMADKVARGKGHSITRYEPVLDELGVSAALPSWQFLLMATSVRHCLLHANGRVKHMRGKDRVTVEEAVRDYPVDLDVQHDRLRVNTEFPKRVVDELRAFRARVEQATVRHEGGRPD